MMNTNPTITATTVGLTGAGLLLMERLANWRLTRARRAFGDLVRNLPADALILGLYRWRAREIAAYHVGGDGILRAAAQSRLGPTEEAACLRWLAVEIFGPMPADPAPAPSAAARRATDAVTTARRNPLPRPRTQPT